MAKPFVLSLSHELGKAEAKRRLTAGLDSLQTHYGKYVTVKDATWDGDRLTFAVTTFGQTASGTIDVEDDRATLNVTLPMLIAMMADKARALMQKEGRLLLEKK